MLRLKQWFVETHSNTDVERLIERRHVEGIDQLEGGTKGEEREFRTTEGESRESGCLCIPIMHIMFILLVFFFFHFFFLSFFSFFCFL